VGGRCVRVGHNGCAVLGAQRGNRSNDCVAHGPQDGLPSALLGAARHRDLGVALHGARHVNHKHAQAGSGPSGEHGRRRDLAEHLALAICALPHRDDLKEGRSGRGGRSGLGHSGLGRSGRGGHSGGRCRHGGYSEEYLKLKGIDMLLIFNFFVTSN